MRTRSASRDGQWTVNLSAVCDLIFCYYDAYDSHENQPAEQKAMATAPQVGHTAKNGSDKARQIGA